MTCVKAKQSAYVRATRQNLRYVLILGSVMLRSSSLLRDWTDEGARRDNMAEAPPSDELAYEISSMSSVLVYELAESANDVSARLGRPRDAMLGCGRWTLESKRHVQR